MGIKTNFTIDNANSMGYNIFERGKVLKIGNKTVPSGKSQLKGYIKMSKVCGECHHGSKKVKRKVDVNGVEMNGYNYEFKEEFKGVGLNRDK